MPTAGKAYGPTQSLYNGIIAAIPGAVGSGIIAAKRGYHSSRAYNRAYFPGDYSIQLSLDQLGPSDGGAAVDVTMSTANMKKYTRRIMDAMDRKDPRVQSIKEVIGTLDGSTVVRYTRTSRTATPVWATSDSSHLWHIHISLFRADVNDWNKLKGIVEVVGGSTGATSHLWGAEMLGLKKGDTGEAVTLLQKILIQAGFSPGASDGAYGPNTSAAVLQARRSQGSTATDGDNITPDAYEQIMRSYMKTVASGTVPTPAPAPSTSEHTHALNEPVKGDSGTRVAYYQRMLSALGFPTSRTKVFDNQTQASLVAWYAQYGDDFDGSAITDWVALQLHKDLLKGEKGDPGADGADGHLTGSFVIEGTVHATVEDTEPEEGTGGGDPE